MRSFLLAIIAGCVLSATGTDIAGEIQAWETETGGLPRDPQERTVEAPDGMALVLLSGQSNMAGRADIPDENRKPLARALKLNRDDEWVPATAPFHFDRKAAGMGPANFFGYDPDGARQFVTKGCYEFTTPEAGNQLGGGYVNMLWDITVLLEEAKDGRFAAADFEDFKREYLRRLSDETANASRCRGSRSETG